MASTLRDRLVLSMSVILIAGVSAAAENIPQPPRRPPLPASPVIEPDGTITFRIRAPEAKVVTVGGDIGQGLPRTDAPPVFPPPPAVVLHRGDDGVWSGSTPAPIRPGAYRYHLTVDGVPVVDPSNAQVTSDQRSPDSVVVVPGDFSETRAVPHGLVSTLTYTAPEYGAGTQRSVIVYTPPGYETSNARYPVLYLLHGGGDRAESWITVGRANNILDNLAAEGRIKPFIVVLLNGWTPKGPQPFAPTAADDPLTAELFQTIIPTIESRFRVAAGPVNRALAGLSMGGYQTLVIGFANIDKFDWILPMSTGPFPPQLPGFIEHNRAAIESADAKLKLFWWGWGTTDIAKQNGLATMAEMRKLGLHKIDTYEVVGGHEWASWRAMLHEYAPKLFRGGSEADTTSP